MDEQQLLNFVRNGTEIYEGARVIAVHGVGNRELKAVRGTVRYVKGIEPYEYYGVEFDEYIGGHNLDSEIARDGYGWNCDKHDIKLLQGET